MKKLLFLLCAGLFVCGCAGLKYSYVSPEAQNFHPQTIAVLPVMVGDYPSASNTIDNVVSQALVKTGWFTNVTDALSLKNQLSASSDLSNDMTGYIQKLNTLSVSDKESAKKIADTLNVDALFLTSVNAWEYGHYQEDKIGKVGLGVKLICGKTGIIMWKANHEEFETYWLIKPDLEDIAEDVMDSLLSEMPH